MKLRIMKKRLHRLDKVQNLLNKRCKRRQGENWSSYESETYDMAHKAFWDMADAEGLGWREIAVLKEGKRIPKQKE